MTDQVTITERARRILRDGRDRDGFDGIDPETYDDVLGLIVEVLDRAERLAREYDRGPEGPLTYDAVSDLIETLRIEAGV